MLAGRGADGVFGFVNTIIAAVAPLGIRPQDLRFIDYADHLPEMYGNTLFVTRELHRDHPDIVRGMVRAFNRGLADTARDPDAAIDALQKRARTNREVDRTRLLGTLRSEMSHPEGARIGIGDMDDARLGLLIDRVVRTRGLPRRPAVAEVFDRRFLPASAERIRSLARSEARAQNSLQPRVHGAFGDFAGPAAAPWAGAGGALFQGLPRDQGAERSAP